MSKPDSIYNNEFVVKPCQNGSFTVSDMPYDRGLMGKTWAFSNVGALLAFLQKQADALAPAVAPQLSAGIAPELPASAYYCDRGKQWCSDAGKAEGKCACARREAAAQTAAATAA